MSQGERAEAGWSVVPPQQDGDGVPVGPRAPDVSEVPGLAGVVGVPGARADPDRRPERAPSRAERRERARSMVGLLSGALTGQVEELGRTADDEAPEGWWFTPSRQG